MVQIHVNQAHDNQFLYNCPCTSTIDETAREIIQIYNLQAKIQHLVPKVEERLLSESKECHTDSMSAMRRVLSEAKTYASKDQVLYKKALSSYILRDHIQSIERAIAANLGLLPDSDLWKQLFSDLELLHEDETQLWWAGKELFRDKRLSDFVGSNEKTKVALFYGYLEVIHP
eukprot:TRINITY_DN19759_c0_g1_i22.p1 TRINITY_DN19759_c0_g1~~TRINITY_DN19759_c0_g1_i22.p1  ORF type:complete len:183 (-),score=33.78 TRINITY_DN19759_c0_g1_i22:566-1084(-)